MRLKRKKPKKPFKSFAKSKKIDNCKIELDANRLIWYSGETLKGYVHLKLKEPMPMECIEVSCNGKVETEWEQIYYVDGKKREREYEAEKKIFALKSKVFGDGDKVEHPVGEFQYPFSFDLPEDIPSSFESKVGEIRYWLKMKIKKPWKNDIKIKRMFIVNTHIDTNVLKYIGGPGDNDDKMLGCFCCQSGPLHLSANIDRSGYCPGEFILITASLTNNTNRVMDKLGAELIQKIQYKGKLENGDPVYHSHHDKTVITEIHSKEIEEESSLSWDKQPLAIPPLPPTIDNCKLITIIYLVHIYVAVPMGFDIDFEFPITIGTVPFKPKYGDPVPSKNVAIPQSRPDPKELSVGLPDLTFLGHGDMKPWVYTQIPKDKKKKMNKDEQEYQDDEYIPVYTYAIPTKLQPPEKPVEPEIDNPVTAPEAPPEEALTEETPPETDTTEAASIDPAPAPMPAAAEPGRTGTPQECNNDPMPPIE